MGKTLVNFLHDGSGITPIEYGIIAFGISLFLLAAATSLGEHLKDVFRLIAVVAAHGNATH